MGPFVIICNIYCDHMTYSILSGYTQRKKQSSTIFETQLPIPSYILATDENGNFKQGSGSWFDNMVVKNYFS